MMNHSDDRSLPADLRDLQILLERSCHDTPAIPLYVERHYGAAPHEVAFVVIALPDQKTRRRVRALAEAGLRHLGYTIQSEGRDVYEVWPRSGEVSAHEAIRALKRFDHMEGAGGGDDTPRAAGAGRLGRAEGGADTG
jgi:hypothetical protein